jgi:hypothetical protein
MFGETVLLTNKILVFNTWGTVPLLFLIPSLKLSLFERFTFNSLGRKCNMNNSKKTPHVKRDSAESGFHQILGQNLE